MARQFVFLAITLFNFAPWSLAQDASSSSPAPQGAISEVAPTANPPKDENPVGSFYLDYLEYEQRVHSTSEITELGEETKLDMAFKYRFNANSDLRLRLDIDPYRYPEENKNSKFELRLFHRYENLEIQGDFDINGDDYNRGATTFGIDDDSDDFWVAYRPVSFFRTVFYPYNFNGEIGGEYRTLDVTRIYYIEGTPSVISELPAGDERIRAKTIPGIEFQIFPIDGLMVYAGVGSVSFEYPADAEFDIKNQTTANVWKIKEDRAYKGGARYARGSTRVVAEYVTHTNAAYTGSLLESAGSVQVQQKIGRTIVDLESTHTKAGSRPYRLSPNGRWFANDRGYNPIYVDYFRQEQNWLGKRDSAQMIQIGYDLGNITPFIAYKVMGEHFIFRKRESAEKLRTTDETQSHGGLQSWKAGSAIKAGKFVFRPEVEYYRAANPVFGNRTDLQDYTINNQSYGRKNTVFTLYTTYAL